MANEKITMIWNNIKLYLLDLTGAGVVGITIEEFFTGTIHLIFAVVGTLIGGSLLFIAQKTILPLIADWINKKLEKWFNKGTKIENGTQDNRSST